MQFSELELIEPLLRALQTEGYTHPTPIQQQAIPIVLQQKDLLGCAQTGTGKTAAFALPILQLLYQKPRPASGKYPIRALVLTPTRELAIQIEESFTAYGRHTGLRHTVIFGGVSAHQQINILRKGIDILVATPGRLLDLMNQGIISLQQLEHFVLDEADRMLDMGFIHDIKKIITRIPVKRQTLFFSATMPAEIAKLANSILSNPVRVEVTPVSSTAEKVTQGVYMVAKSDKPKLLTYLMGEHAINGVLVFSRTKHGADKLVKVLRNNDISADAIHGNKAQNARQNALKSFKTGKIKVLVATDIAARGIDIDDLQYVINFDLPNEPETYVHRIGRTGRAGASGIAWSFCDPEERPYLQDINKLTAQTIPVLNDHPFAVPGSLAIIPSATKGTTPPKKQQNRGGWSRNSRR